MAASRRDAEKASSNNDFFQKDRGLIIVVEYSEYNGRLKDETFLYDEDNFDEGNGATEEPRLYYQYELYQH